MDPDPIALVREIFAELSRGNISALVDRCADDVELHVFGPPEVPFAGRRRGRDQVQRFLRDAVLEVVETYELSPRELLAAGDHVVVLGSSRCRVRANGHEYRNEWAVIMTLRDGRFTRIAEYFDSAVTLLALRGESSGVTREGV